VLALWRFRYDDDLTDRAADELARCLEALQQRDGFVTGVVGRALDDPTLWVLETQWGNVGSYRRALSAYDIRMSVGPILAQAVDEPSAYEVLSGGASTLNEARPRIT
jgi:quinol monooxygenase YgiN